MLPTTNDSKTDRHPGPLGHRPRLGHEGRLLLPSALARDPDGAVRGSFGDRDVDPFNSTSERLLLPEAFARIDLGDHDAAVAWFLRNGVVDAHRFSGTTQSTASEDWFARSDDVILDRSADVAIQQANVRWHLATLARLSDTRGSMDWDPAWGRLVIASPRGRVVVGDGAGNQQPTPSTRSRKGRAREAADGEIDTLPSVWVSNLDRVFAPWQPSDRRADIPSADTIIGRMASSWDDTVTLESVLMAPYVQLAARRRVGIAIVERAVDGRVRGVVEPREEGPWRSILAPVYLLLFESLRRISEGEPGAAVCRECGLPFLIIDARRRHFCNDRDRYRFTQRERRRRLAGDVAP